MAAPIVMSDEQLFQLTGSWEAAAALRDVQNNALNQYNWSKAAPVVEPVAAVAAPITSLLDLPKVAPVDEPTAAPIIETVAAPTAPIAPIAPVQKAKTGTEQMVDLLIKNPNLTDVELVKAMETYKVSPADLAKATVSDEGKIVARVAATIPEGNSVTLGDTRIAPNYAVTGRGEDRQVGGIENITVEKTTGDVNYKAPVGSEYKVLKPDGTFESTGTIKKDLSFLGGLADALNDPVIKTALMATGLPAGIGEAVGLGTGATATAVGTGLLNAGTTAATGADLKDVVKAGVIGGGASLLGSTVSDLLKPTIDASTLTSEEFNDLINKGFTEDLKKAGVKNVSEFTTNVGGNARTFYDDAGNPVVASPTVAAPATTPVAPTSSADNLVINAPRPVAPPVTPTISSVISAIGTQLPDAGTVKVEDKKIQDEKSTPIVPTTPTVSADNLVINAPRPVAPPTSPTIANVISAIGTQLPNAGTVKVEDKRINDEKATPVVPTTPTVPELTVTGTRPVITAPTTPITPIVPTVPLVLPTIPPAPPTPPTPPAPPPDKTPSITDIIKTIAPLVLAPAVVNSLTPTKTTYPIVPIPTDWKPPTTQPTSPYQPLTPIDFGNQNLLKGTQWEKFLDPNYGKVPTPTMPTAPASNMSYSNLMDILGSKQGAPMPASNLSINDIISGIQNQYGQANPSAMG